MFGVFKATMIGQPNDSEINKRISNLEVEYFNQQSTRSGGMNYTRDQQNIFISQAFSEWNSNDKKRISTCKMSYRLTNIFPMLR